MLVGGRSSHIPCALRRFREEGVLVSRYGRHFVQSRRLPQQSKPSIRDEDETDRAEEAAEMRQEVGRMTERLTQMTEESIEGGGRGARRAVEEAGFSEQLKKQLEERLEQSKFKGEHATAFAEVTLPVCSLGLKLIPPLIQNQDKRR